MTRTKNKQLLTQFVQYMIAGGAFFWSGYAAFAVFDGVFGWSLFVSKQLANVVGLTVNYLLQDGWVFKRQGKKQTHATRTWRYILLVLVNFAIDYAIVASLDGVGITPYIGQFVSAGFFTIWNFVWYRYWVFAQHTPKRRK